MISVVMPAYNTGKYIGEAIESILNQTFQDFEIIVIDDGSSDNTVDVVMSYMEKDNRIRLIQNQHGGVSRARNAGVETAKYDWIALLDSDDVALPERLEKQWAAIQNDPEVIVWDTGIKNMGADGQIRPELKQIAPSTKEEFFKKRKEGEVVYVGTTSAIFRRDIGLQVGGFDVRFKNSGDTEFWNRMGQHGPMLSVQEPLTLYRLHGESLTSKSFEHQFINGRFIQLRAKAWAQGKDLLYEDYINDYNNQPPLKRFLRNMNKASRRFYRDASVYISSKNYIKGFTYLGMSLLLNPFLISGRIWNRLMRIRG